MKFFNRYAGKITFLSVVLAALVLSGSITTFASTHPGKTKRAAKTMAATRAKVKPRRKSRKRKHRAAKAKTVKKAKSAIKKGPTPPKKS